MKNKTCNTGYVAWYVKSDSITTIIAERNRVDKVTPEDAHLLQLLAKAGAVFHVRTNQPQSLMVSSSEDRAIIAS
jgi:Asp-tRNA(Asn)/Glu-tRNA(Gln) amidotransferase A subunit family amidase